VGEARHDVGTVSRPATAVASAAAAVGTCVYVRGPSCAMNLSKEVLVQEHCPARDVTFCVDVNHAPQRLCPAVATAGVLAFA